MINELHITLGRPGSGKTTWADEFVKAKFNAVVIHCDDITPPWANALKCINRNTEIVIVDGLFKNMDDIRFVYESVDGVAKVKKVIIHRWNDDIESCLWNDKGRREIDSELTIRKMKIAKIKPSDFFDFPVHVQVENHTVVRKPEFLMSNAFANLEIKDGRYMDSDHWTISKTYHHYWSSSCSHKEYDVEPLDFVELEEYLMSLDLHFPYLLYKKIWRECVTKEEDYISDYYESSTVQFWRCDMEKLYQILKQYKYV